MKNQNALVYDVRNILTIRDLMEGSVDRYADCAAFAMAEGDTVHSITYAEAYEQVKALATYLRRLVPAGSKIAVTGKNSYHWALSYLAVTCGVGVVVPIDKDLRGDEIAALVKDSEASVLLYSHEQADKVAEVSDCLCLDMKDMEAYLSEGTRFLADGDRAYAEHVIQPNALGVLLYTSGTTGVAKGVMLSQYNICCDITSVLRRVRIDPTDVALSVLPLHHTYECTVGLLCMLSGGVCIAYNSSLRRLQAELKLFRPTVMAVVPLILETFRNAIVKKYHQIKGGKLVLSLQRTVSDLTGNRSGKKIFSIVNETFGGRMRMLVCGAALLPPEVFRDYQRFGMKVLIGYGLTETAPVCIMHDDRYQAPDDIGFPMSGVLAKLDEVNEEGVGELCIKGGNVMMGYYKNPEETARVIDSEGWFHTGDLARLTARGTYQIAGRAKSMIVSPGGKKIFPEELELFLGASPYIKECLVYESGPETDRHVTAALYPDAEAMEARLAKDGIVHDTVDYEVAERALLEDVVKTVNARFPHYKHITRTVVRREEFVKTTTKKIRRNAPENLTEG